MRRTVGYSGLPIVLLGMLCATSAGEPPARPSLQLEDGSGQVHRLQDYRGKIVVLNFWATWCGPCAAEMPVFVNAQERFGARGVVVLAASLDSEETQENIAAFVKKHRLDFPVLTGASTVHLEEFGLGESLPATVFLDPDGAIAFRILGRAHKKQVFQRIEWMLGDGRGDEPKQILDNF